MPIFQLQLYDDGRMVILMLIPALYYCNILNCIFIVLAHRSSSHSSYVHYPYS